MAPAQGWCVVVESRRAARARSEESDRDPDGSSPAECGETDRRAFVVVARRHTITLKSYTVFFCVSVCVIFPFFPGSGLHAPGRSPARARSRRDEATRDGRWTVRRRRSAGVDFFFFVVPRRSFATRDLRSFVRVARARARRERTIGGPSWRTNDGGRRRKKNRRRPTVSSEPSTVRRASPRRVETARARENGPARGVHSPEKMEK